MRHWYCKNEEEDLAADQRLEQTARELARHIDDAMNDYSAEAVIAATVEHLARTHRAIQHTITKLCVAWIQRLAKDHAAGNFDARNECAAILCSKVVERMGSELVLGIW